MSHDPPRLRDDPSAPDELRELMAQPHEPPELDAATKAASIASVLSASSAAAASATGAAASTATAGATATGVKLWLVAGGLSVVSLAAGITYVTTGEDPPEPEPEPAPAASVAAPSPEDPPEVATGELASRETDEPEPAPHAQEAKPEPAPSRTGEAAAEPAEPAADTLLVEAELLETARARLDSSPWAALRATRRHAREHPHGQLRAERELLAIQALQKLGRDRDARRRARAFLRAHPTGIYADRARRVLEQHEGPLPSDKGPRKN